MFIIAQEEMVCFNDNALTGIRCSLDILRGQGFITKTHVVEAFPIGKWSPDTETSIKLATYFDEKEAREAWEDFLQAIALGVGVFRFPKRQEDRRDENHN